jgi:hypothetical protein
MGTQAQENRRPGTAEWETPVRLVGDIGCGCGRVAGVASFALLAVLN